MDVTVERDTRTELLTPARRLAAATAAGALAGLVMGGVGGRIAMLVLRLTSDPRLHGLETDDGFTIGIVSGATMVLLAITTVIGAVGGVAYLLARPWLPERLRPWAWGLLGALVGGSRIVSPEGIDFTLLDPLPLAVAMFVLIPALGSAATSVLAERLLRPSSPFQRSTAALGALVLLVPVVLGTGMAAGGPLGPVVLLAAGAVLVWTGAGGVVARMWGSAPAAWLGRAGLATLALLAGADLLGSTRAIL